MKISPNVKPALWGGVVGAIGMMVVLFGGFAMTDGNAEKMANDRAEAALKTVAINVLPAICVAQAQADLESATKLAEMSAVTGYQRTSKLVEASWTKIDGVELSSANRSILADACGKLLFPATDASSG